MAPPHLSFGRMKAASWAFLAAEASWLLLLALLPAVFNPFGAAGIEPMKASLLRCLAAISVVSWVAGRSLRAGHPAVLGSRAIVYSGLSVVVAAALSALFSPDPAQSFFGSYDRGTGLLSLGAGLALLVSGADLFSERRRRERMLTALVVGALIPCAYGLLQYLGRDPLTWVGARSMASTLGSPNFLASFLVMIIPLGLYRVTSSGRTLLAVGAGPMAAQYAFFFALVLIMAVVIVQTAVRGAMLGLAMGVAAFAVMATERASVVQRLVAVATVALLLSATFGLAVVAAAGADLPLIRRFLEVADPSDSVSGRVMVWLAAAPLPLLDPFRFLLGYGQEMQTVAFEHAELIVRGPADLRWDRAHNLLVDTWLTGGLLGLLTLLGLVGATAWRSWRVIRSQDREEALLAAAVLSALAGHLVEVSFGFQTVVTGAWFWVLAAVAASLGQPQPLRMAQAPNERAGRAWAGLALVAGVIAFPALAAPAVADHLHGAAIRAERTGAREEAARLAEAAASWAPWVEEIPRFAGLNWQALGLRRSNERLLAQAEAQLAEAARRGRFDPYAHLRLARHYLVWAGRTAEQGRQHELLSQAERACVNALTVGPFRGGVWEACAQVSRLRGDSDQAEARVARAKQLRAPT